MIDFEKLGAFYLGRHVDREDGETTEVPTLYEAKDLTTHAVCVGMTGSGKTGLCIGLLEEAAIDGIPALCIDPKGDLGNLLLTFPALRATDFEPWVDPAEAERKGRSVVEHAEAVADRWRRGLADWGQDGARIGRFRDSVELAIYTPGSHAGRPLRMLESFAPPSGEVDADWVREGVMSAVSSLLALVGIEPDPVNSKEHILLSNILARAWEQGETLTLADLVRAIGAPPFDRVGVMDLETFYPAEQRQKLAMKINGVIASPGFSAWLEGEPLDIQKLLWTDDGKPRVAILSIAHLRDEERMFFVSSVFDRVVQWMRQQSGTSSLRAIVYMDEVFGFLPPVAEPPSKAPLLTLLKQARAFGVGVVLATQNPVDIDYKALSNCGTWFLGRLQTERDVARVLDGLQGASEAAGRGFERGDVERLLAGLKSRVFLVNNSHREAPVLFHTRWAMSYLRGPLTRSEIKRLVPATVAPEHRRAARRPEPSSPPAEAAPPIIPSGIAVAFVDEGPGRYEPMLTARVSLHYSRASFGLDEWSEHLAVAPLGDDPWDASEILEHDALDLGATPPEDASFGTIPGGSVSKSRFRSYRKELRDHVYQHQPRTLWQCKRLKLRSKPDESKGEFAARVQLAVREKRDAKVEALTARFEKKLERLAARTERAEARVEREKGQYEQQKLQTGISMGATILGAIFGSRGMGRATSAARGAGRVARERQDIARAERDVDALEAQQRALEDELDHEVRALQSDAALEVPEIEEVLVRPKKADIRVPEVVLTWRLG